MKKIFLTSFASLLFTLLLFTGCQKSIKETTEETASKPPEANSSNQCQLTHMALEGFDNRFHYNNKGLADEWQIDYGTGIPDVFTMTYDNKNRLSHAWLHYDGVLYATIDFVWVNNLLTEEHWDYSGFFFDGVNTYNKKGQMIKREFSHGWSGASEYSSNGNIPKREVFFGGELIQRAEYTFNQPNRNPFLAIQGIPYGFPFVVFDFSKWWETSEKISIYDGGVPTVIEDMDPAQTVFHFGAQNYPASVDHFDLITNGPILFNFEYQNCGSENNASANVSRSPAISSIHHKNGFDRNRLPLKVGPPEQMKKQLQKMRKQ